MNGSLLTTRFDAGAYGVCRHPGGQRSGRDQGNLGRSEAQSLCGLCPARANAWGLPRRATSGLDSESAISIMQTLKTLAVEGGCTILCTLHQPNSDITELFDDFMLLASGRMVNAGAMYLLTVAQRCHCHPVPTGAYLEHAPICMQGLSFELICAALQARCT